MAYDSRTSYAPSDMGPAAGSGQNAPLTSRQKYGLDVIIAHGPPPGPKQFIPDPAHPGSFLYESVPQFVPDPNNPGSFTYGDTTVDLSVLLNELYLMKPDDLKNLKTKLVAAGFLAPGNDSPGALQSAYENALVWASQAGKTPDEALDFLAKSGAFGTAAGAGRAPFSPVVASPTDIKAAVDAYAPQTLGHDLTDAEKEKLVALYQQVQTSAQKANYDANISGGSATAPPALDAFVQQQATALHPQDAVDYGNLLQARTFMNMIGNFQGSQG